MRRRDHSRGAGGKFKAYSDRCETPGSADSFAPTGAPAPSNFDSPMVICSSVCSISGPIEPRRDHRAERNEGGQGSVEAFDSRVMYRKASRPVIVHDMKIHLSARMLSVRGLNDSSQNIVHTLTIPNIWVGNICGRCHKVCLAEAIRKRVFYDPDRKAEGDRRRSSSVIRRTS